MNYFYSNWINMAILLDQSALIDEDNFWAHN